MEHRDETPIDVVVEMCVYAPLGFALEARSLLPRFVERGRNQVAMARVVGKFAARKGRETIEERLEGGQEAVVGLLQLTGVVGPATTEEGVEEPDAVVRARAAAASRSPTGTSAGNGSRPEPATTTARADRVGGAAGPAAAGAAVPVEGDLAIPGYGSLAASQVVPRLASLSDEELDQVRRFEAAHRGRRTILNRIGQLQSS